MINFKLSIFLIFFALHASYQSSRMLDTNYVTKSGTLAINGDGGGYYLNADLAYHFLDASESENFDNSIVSMMLALYTSQTMLIDQSCLYFDVYNCEEYSCTPYTTSSSDPVFPYFQVTGYSAKADLYLDYTHWELNTNATLATSCTATNTSYGQGRYGILGLGRNGTEANFLGNSTLFSVYLDPEYGKSTLLFSSNTNITSISTVIGSIVTNADWNILPSSVQVSFLSYSTTETLGAIFDINANGIGIPLDIYNEIITTLQNTGAINCEGGGLLNLMCYYYPQKGVTLPTLTFTIQGIEINLPPDLYVKGSLSGTANTMINLNLKAVDPTLNDSNYVTSAYQNYIIFDQNFLSYYYTEYQCTGSSYTVTLYKPNFLPESPVVWPWIVGGVFGFIVIVCVIVFFVRRYRIKKRNENELSKQSHVDGVNKLSQGLVSADKVVGGGEVYAVRDYTTYQYGHESWISPDVPQSS